MKINIKIKKDERPLTLYPKRMEYIKQLSNEVYGSPINTILEVPEKLLEEDWMLDMWWVDEILLFKKIKEDEWLVFYKSGEIIKIYLT